MTTKQALVVKKMQDNIDRVNALDDCFREMFSRDPDVYIKFLFVINNKFQMFIKSCFYNPAGQGLTVRYLNFEALFDMLESRYFSVNLPIILTISLRKFCGTQLEQSITEIVPKEEPKEVYPGRQIKLEPSDKTPPKKKNWEGQYQTNTRSSNFFCLETIILQELWVGIFGQTKQISPRTPVETLYAYGTTVTEFVTTSTFSRSHTSH